MSKQHILKIHPKPLADLISGAKTCEVRFNDRGFEVGDTVVLREINPANEEFTGRPDHTRTITHIQQGYGLPDHLCVLSYTQPAAGEPVEIEVPTFSPEGMGCGLEDRGITDRYEAMEYGYNEALEQQWQIINSHGPLFTVRPAPVYSAAGEPLAWMTKPLRGSNAGKLCLCDPFETRDPELWASPFPVFATQPAAGEPKWSCLNAWFLSLEQCRQEVLREDKWMLAGAAFDAGRQFSVPPAASVAAGESLTGEELYNMHKATSQYEMDALAQRLVRKP